ncbi:MAG: helix-turn-helix domain containing protein [Azospirillaceae bacterium]|nr:helix-turn-helix domain containing protein [Azospirillaceae bacterium]
MSEGKFSDVIMVTNPVEANRGTEAPRPLSGSGSADANKQSMAERLRSHGWSYRRIAEDLGVSYVLVSRWLDGLPPAGKAEPVERSRPRTAANRATPSHGRAARPTAAAGDATVLEVQFQAFERYVGEVIDRLVVRLDTSEAREESLRALLAAAHTEGQAREARLLTLLDQERSRWAEAERGFRREFEAFKAEIRTGMPTFVPGTVAGLVDEPAAEAAAVATEPAATDEDPFNIAVTDEDPFKVDAPDDDPFKVDGPDDDPFKADGPDDDPFKAEAADDDPFKVDAPDDDPFKVDAADDDPFKVEAADDDPFKVDAVDDDPFKVDSARDDPFKIDAASDDPFQTSLDSVPAPETDRDEPEPEPEAPKSKKSRLLFWRR